MYKNKIALTGRTVGLGDLWILPIDVAVSLEEKEKHV